MIKTFLPDKTDFELLERLAGPIAAFVRPPVTLATAPSCIFLQPEKGPLLGLSVNYGDVAFKFEWFNLVVEPETPEALSNAIPVAHIEGWQTIKCCFRFEWERPAFPGETRPSQVKLIQQIGKKIDIPNTATAAYVSMAGIVFWDNEQDVPVSAIIRHEEDTVTMRLYKNRNDIEIFMAKSETVDLGEAQQWCVSQN